MKILVMGLTDSGKFLERLVPLYMPLGIMQMWLAKSLIINFIFNINYR